MFGIGQKGSGETDVPLGGPEPVCFGPGLGGIDGSQPAPPCRGEAGFSLDTFGVSDNDVVSLHSPTE